MDKIKRSGDKPIYVQLRELLRGKIESGEYPPGSRIPSENQLAQQYGIHRLSVRSALSALTLEGLLKSVQGKGVYVTGPRIDRNMDTLGGFKQTMLARNLLPSVRILDKIERPAGPYYARLFGLSPEDSLFYIRRLLSGDGQPVSLEEVFISQRAVPGFLEPDLSVFSIYEIYEFLGISLARAQQRLDIALLDAADARLLGTAPGQAVLHFQGLTYDANDAVIEYASTYTRGDHCNYSVQFSKE